MKKENLELKEVIKEAILEAFAEMHGVATLNEDTDDSAPEDGEDGEGSDKKDPVRPGPVIGPVGLSLR